MFGTTNGAGAGAGSGSSRPTLAARPSGAGSTAGRPLDPAAPHIPMNPPPIIVVDLEKKFSMVGREPTRAESGGHTLRHQLSSLRSLSLCLCVLSCTQVVAIDFGTARTGYAWSQRDAPTIVCDHTWPRMNPGIKTRTCVLLNAAGDFLAFGEDAVHQYTSANKEKRKDWMFFENFKMKLFEQESARNTIKVREDKRREARANRQKGRMQRIQPGRQGGRRKGAEESARCSPYPSSQAKNGMEWSSVKVFSKVLGHIKVQVFERFKNGESRCGAAACSVTASICRGGSSVRHVCLPDMCVTLL
jgi:hypothetical protein